MEKNKALESLRRKKDFELLKQKASIFSDEWLKFLFLYEKQGKKLKVAWSLPKKYIPRAVTRNRLRRWGRENIQLFPLRGMALMVFFRREKHFYKKLKRKDFDIVFKRTMEKALKAV